MKINEIYFGTYQATFDCYIHVRYARNCFVTAVIDLKRRARLIGDLKTNPSFVYATQPLNLLIQGP